MDIPYSPGGGSIFSACLSPQAAEATNPTNRGKPSARVVTFDMPVTGAVPERTAPPSTPLESVTKFFSLDNMEQYLNCVPLTIDPRSPDSALAKAASAFSFGGWSPMNGAASANHPERNRQDKGQDRLSKHESTELSFMAEREAVMEGVMDDNAIDKCKDEGTLLQLVHQAAMKLSGASDATKPSENEPTTDLFMEDRAVPAEVSTSTSGGTSSGGSGGGGGGGYAGFFGMDSSEVPGGLWTLPSNEGSKENDVSFSASIDSTTILSEDQSHMRKLQQGRIRGVTDVLTALRDEIEEEEESNHVTMLREVEEIMKQVSMLRHAQANLQKTENDIFDSHTQSTQSDGDKKEESDPILMMRSPMAKSRKGSDDAPESAWLDHVDGSTEEDLSRVAPSPPPLELEVDDFFKSEHSDAPELDPILAAQRAISQAMSPNSANTNGSYDEKYWMDADNGDAQEVGEEILYEVQHEVSSEEENFDNHQGEVDEEDPCQANDIGTLADDPESEGSNFGSNTKDEKGLDEHILGKEDDYSSYIPNAEELPRLLASLGEEHEEEGVAKQPLSSSKNSRTEHSEATQDTVVSQEKKYASDEEANKHFDELMKSFELSLNRRVDSTKKRSKHKSRAMRGAYHGNARTQLSPLAAAAHRKKREATRKKVTPKETHQDPEDDVTSKASTASSRSSLFFEGTVMGRKMSPYSPRARKKLTSPATNASKDDDCDIIDRAKRVVHGANEVIGSSTVANTSDVPESQQRDIVSEDAAVTTESVSQPHSEECPDDETQAPDIINYNLDEMEFIDSNSNRRDRKDQYVLSSEPAKSCSISERLKKRSAEMKRLAVPARDLTEEEDCPDDERMGMGTLRERGQQLEFDYDDPVSSPSEAARNSWFLDNSCNLEGSAGEGDEVVGRESSFDSSVNWDNFQYSQSMSDNTSANESGSSNNLRLDVKIPAWDSSRGLKVGESESPAAIGSSSGLVSMEDEDAASPVTVDESALATPSSAVESSGIDYSNPSMISYLRRRKKAQPSFDQRQDANTVDAVLTPKAWDRIEQIKQRHDDEIGKIRETPKSSLNESESPISSTSDEENAAPLLSPNTRRKTDQMKRHLEYMKMQHEQNVQQLQLDLASPTRRDLDPASPASCGLSPKYQHLETPRSWQGKTELDIQSRINAMREQHKKNMNKMRHVLEDLEQGSSQEVTNDEVHDIRQDTQVIAESVGRWKSDAKRSEKARARYNRFRNTSTSPRRQYFDFDKTTSHEVDDKLIASPRKNQLSPTPKGGGRSSSIQELMMRNEELEEEMRQIRLLSPKNQLISDADGVASPMQSLSPASFSASSPLSGIKKDQSQSDISSQHDIHATLSTRYTSKLSPPFQSQTISDNVPADDRNESEIGVRVSGLIADVKSFLQENDREQDRLSGDTFALRF